MAKRGKQYRQQKAKAPEDVVLRGYDTDQFFVVLVDLSGRARPNAEVLVNVLIRRPFEELARRQQAIESALF